MPNITLKTLAKRTGFSVTTVSRALKNGSEININTKKKVMEATSEIFKGKFKSSRKVILEEFLNGEEASYFIIVDNFDFKFFGTAQDHKRAYENDKGANTGGMGAYSPAPIITKRLEKKIISKIIKPTLKALKKKMQREGIFREMKLRNHYEKPSVKKAREKAEAIRRGRKLARKKLQRDGSSIF